MAPPVSTAGGAFVVLGSLQEDLMEQPQDLDVVESRLRSRDLVTNAATVRGLDPNPYHPAVAAHAGELSRLVYAGRAQFSDVVHGLGYQLWGWFDVKSTQGALVLDEEGGRAFLVWRGSLGLSDWREDAQISRVRWRGVLGRDDGRVHRGFRNQLERVREDLARSVESLLEAHGQDVQLSITGHSLGGDLATLTPDLLDSIGLPWSTSYTFEAARPGNRRWGEAFGDRHAGKVHRVVVVHPEGEMDLIPRTPPSRPGPWPLGWSHPRVVPEIHWRDQRFTSEDTWQKYRSSRPVPWWQALRVFSRLSWSIQAHLSRRLVVTLVEQAHREGFAL